MLADFLRVDSATLAALGLVAVLAGTANTPLAASIMAIELFGPEIAPYAAVACVISFLVTGQQSIYPSQRISLEGGKAGETAPSAPTASDLPLRPTKIPYRKTMFKQAFKKMTKHLIPNPKGFEEDK